VFKALLAEPLFILARLASPFPDLRTFCGMLTIATGHTPQFDAVFGAVVIDQLYNAASFLEQERTPHGCGRGRRD